MLNNQISKRYAAAFFEIARDSGGIEEVFNDLNKFINFCYDKLCLKEFLSQTYIDKNERFEVVGLLAKDLSLSAYFINFLHLLIENERTGYLPKIFREYSALRDDFLNILRTNVVSAKELDAKETDRIKFILESSLNKKIIVSNEVNEDIIGGYIINIENISYDGSIKTQMDNFYNYLKQGAFIYGD
ncbi:MAG: ATP synthase F1 subunit delta [bacterium]